MPSLLIIEDSKTHRDALRRTLGAGELFDRILEAEDGIQGLKLLLSEDVDMVLCDLEMPGLQGDKLLTMSRNARGRRVPFLILTAVKDVERAARLFRRGARDVITKPFHPVDLTARLGLHLRLLRLEQTLQEQNERLEEISTTDALSGLRNRRYLDEVIDTEFHLALRGGPPFAVVIGDIDHFKQVNDRHGHPAGDAVIRAVAERIGDHLRRTDVAGRFGGEEFVVLLRGGTLADAEVAAERWRQVVESSPIGLEDGASVEVTMSFGAASWRPDRFADAAGLLAAADAALYMAKAGGRNQVEVDPESRRSEAG